MDILPDDAPAPRLCHLIKWPDFDGYGFNLHAERSNPGQFIGKIDDESPAQMAGLREGDRIVEVNGVNISNENHRQVVERIKSEPNETKLLVLDPKSDAWYKEQDLVVKSSQMNVVYSKTPVPRPQPDSPRAKFHSPLPGDQQEQVSSLSPVATTAGSSSLETSDYNETDSIEAANNNNNNNNNNNDGQQSCSNKSPSPAPMSPDSGRGHEDNDDIMAKESGLVCIEAEMNRQTPTSKLQASDSIETSDSNKEEEDSSSSATNQLQPDSLGTASMSPEPQNVSSSKQLQDSTSVTLDQHEQQVSRSFFLCCLTTSEL